MEATIQNSVTAFIEGAATVRIAAGLNTAASKNFTDIAVTGGCTRTGTTVVAAVGAGTPLSTVDLSDHCY